MSHKLFSFSTAMSTSASNTPTSNKAPNFLLGQLQKFENMWISQKEQIQELWEGDIEMRVACEEQEILDWGSWLVQSDLVLVS
jgi:hypothetical protein